MDRFETVGGPSSDECLGVVGLSIALVGASAGILARFFREQTTPAFAVIVASPFVGRVSFRYCVVWGESR